VNALGPESLDVPVRLIAPPGAGKTQALVDLYAELVSSGRASRAEILVLTFSAAAAREIADRLDDRLQDSYDRSSIGTFHSFCARLVREWRPDPRRLLLDGFQEWLVMRHTLHRLETAELGRLARLARSDGLAQDAVGFVALLKQNLVHPASLSLLAEVDGTPRLRALARIFAAYQSRLDAGRLRDFRDLVADAIELLQARPEVLEQLRARFRYVLVDEFQDVDPAQFALLRILVSPGPGAPALVVAGDPDQSIYGFRGTVPRLLSTDFGRVFGGREVQLGKSRRCPPAILAAARRLLAAAGSGVLAEKMVQAEEVVPEPATLRVVRATTAVEEAMFVAREIRRLTTEQGIRPSQMAVLLRSTAWLGGPFEQALRGQGVPYEVCGLGGLARNEVVRFLLAYMDALRHPDDPQALERLLSSGLSGVDHRTASRIRRYAVEEGRPFARVVRRLMYWLRGQDPTTYPLPWGEVEAGGEQMELEMEVPGEEEGKPPMAFVPYLRDHELTALHRAVAVFHRLGRRAPHLSVAALAYAVLLEAGVMERVLALAESQRQEALEHLRGALDAFMRIQEVWERLHGAPPRLAELPQLDTWIVRAVEEAEPVRGSRDAVQVMTVHQAKGLEFEVVFLAGFARGVFPIAGRPHPLLEDEDRSWLQRNLAGFRPSWPLGPAEQVEEEARVAYVAMTRARRRLYLSWAETYEGPAGPSPFLELALPGVTPELFTPSVALPPSSVLALGEAEALLAGHPLTAAQRQRLAALGADLDFVEDPEVGRPFEPYRHRPQGVEPDHFSPTSLNDYLKCPRLYWYNHHPGLVAPPRGVELERGSFVHRVLEEFHAREEEWRHLEPALQRDWLERILQRHLEAYLARVDAVLDRKAEELRVRRILDNYIRFATSLQPIRRLGTLMVERRFRLELEGAELHGKIDRVNDTGGGTCEVVDYKTGRGKSVQGAYDEYFGPDLQDVQLATYYLACTRGVDEEGRPIALRPRFLSLWYPRDQIYGQMRQVLFPLGEAALGVKEWLQHPITEEDVERGRRVLVEAIRRIRAGDFAPAPRATVGTCLSWFGCPHASICPFGGQPTE
jgi:DNA helicase-2/ATP-dependent DNA helicase PcrA